MSKKNALLDVIDFVTPEVKRVIQTNAPDRVGILQKFVKNVSET